MTPLRTQTVHVKLCDLRVCFTEPISPRKVLRDAPSIEQLLTDSHGAVSAQAGRGSIWDLRPPHNLVVWCCMCVANIQHTRCLLSFVLYAIHQQ